jgi:hypothetical protein
MRNDPATQLCNGGTQSLARRREAILLEVRILKADTIPDQEQSTTPSSDTMMMVPAPARGKAVRPDHDPGGEIRDDRRKRSMGAGGTLTIATASSSSGNSSKAVPS